MCARPRPNRNQAVASGFDAREYYFDGTRTFIYNQNNRLAQVKEGAAVISEYAYDGFGRRVKKTVGSEILHFHYDLSG